MTRNAETDTIREACDQISQLRHPAYVKDSQLRFVEANAAFGECFALQSADLPGRRREDVCHGEGLADWEEKERRCLVFGESQVAEFKPASGGPGFSVTIDRLEDQDGNLFVLCFSGPTLASVGSQPVVLELQNDAMVNGLRQQDIQSLVQNLADLDVGFIIYDADQILRFCNHKIYVLFPELTSCMLIGAPASQILGLVYDNNLEAQTQIEPGLSADVMKQNWIAEKLRTMRDPVEEIRKIADGRWLKWISRSFSNGLTIFIAVEIAEQRQLKDRLDSKNIESSRFKAILEDLPVAVYMRDADDKLLFANSAYAEIFDKTVDDCIGKTPYEMFGDICVAPVSALRTGLETSNRSETMLELPNGNGEIRHYLSSAKRMVDDDCQRILMGVVHDISDIKLHETELTTARKQAQAARDEPAQIIDLIPVAIVVLDAEQRFEMVNREFMEIRHPEEHWIIGRPYRDYLEANLRRNAYDLPEEELRHVVDGRMDMVLAGTEESIEISLKNGKKFAFSATPFGDGRSLLAFVDITELRKRDVDVLEARDALNAQNRLLGEATRVMAQGLIIIEDDMVVFANDGCAAMLHMQEDYFLPGGPLSTIFQCSIERGDFTDFAAAEKLYVAIDNHITKGQTFVENLFLQSLGRWIKLECIPAGETRMVAVLTDITEIKQRELELEKLLVRAEDADRAKSTFLANVGHEIRMPMNGIRGMAELLGRSNLDTRQKSFVDIIQKSSQAMMAIINDILDVNDLDSGQIELEPSPFNPSDVIDEVATLLSGKANDKLIDVIVRTSPDLPLLVNGDMRRFRQIAYNLASNAVRFTDKGHVLLELRCEGDQLVLAVTDTGCGIPVDQQDAIFQKFTQLGESGVRNHEGTGLGLPIVSGLVSLMGGRISVHSAVAGGSCFTVSLPLPVVRRAEKNLGGRLDLAGARVLVLDENPVSRDIVLELLCSWNIDAVAADTCDMARSIAAAAGDMGVSIDVLLLDLVDDDGADRLELLRHLRNDPQSSQIDIVLLSPLGSNIDADLFRSEDIQGHLIKPLNGAELRALLVDLMRRRTVARLGHHAASNVIEAKDFRARSTPANSAAPVARPPVPDSRQSTSSVEILVAEDNKLNQQMFAEMLQVLERRFFIVGNGQEAVESWQSLCPDIVLMDIAMPLLDGRAATRRIRALERDTGHHTGIIGIVPSRDPQVIADCLEAGMDDVISKPVDMDELQHKIKAWLKIPDEERTFRSVLK